jgi:predicted RND superfamily exporter protein
MPLAAQHQLIDQIRSGLDPPRGVRARLGGLPVLAAEANDRLASPWRRLGLLAAGLLAVGLALWVVFRDGRRALVPLVPIALATGWASLAVAPIALNPMSATLGALVVAISTEFSVLLAERYRQERVAGRSVEAAVGRAYRSTGAAVLASGLTAIAGFAVLVVSEISMLRNFGLVTVLDLSIALVGVLLVLPAVLVLDERGALLALPRRALAALPPRPRRTAPDA